MTRVCRTATIALTGLSGSAVYVEAAVNQQLPGMAIIGLPDAALAEAKLRVRTAATQSGLSLSSRFITVNLAPAALPKHGTGFDLAIALSVLSASGHLPSSQLETTAHFGELGLDGTLRRPNGLLSAVLAARDLGFRQVMVPSASFSEAQLIPDIEVIAVPDLRSAVAWHHGEQVSQCITPPTPPRSSRLLPDATNPHALDMAEVTGQADAIEALVVAAAGRHHLAMVGPPGAGKSLLATRLPSLLPDLSGQESLMASSIASLGGTPVLELVTRPPFESPHHTATSSSLVGGGQSAVPRIGAITRACHGVLFLDEAPEFKKDVLEALRQPLESGSIEIHRANMRTTFPARTQLVLAANPCPCGKAGSPETALQCECTPQIRRRYLRKLSGPLADRIDLQLSVRRVSTVARPATAGLGMVADHSSAALREKVTLARERSAHRLRETPWRVNADVPGDWLRGLTLRLPNEETAVLDQALRRGSITMRGYDRVLRLAWTVSDLSGVERPGRREIAQALSLRSGAFS